MLIRKEKYFKDFIFYQINKFYNYKVNQLNQMNLLIKYFISIMLN